MGAIGVERLPATKTCRSLVIKLGSEETGCGIAKFWTEQNYSGEVDSWDGGEHLWKTFSSVRKSIVRKLGKKKMETNL